MTQGSKPAMAGETGFRAEDLFLAWLFHLPAGTDVGAAARAEISRLDREGGVSDGVRYRAFLSQAMTPPPIRGQRRRLHH